MANVADRNSEIPIGTTMNKMNILFWSSKNDLAFYRKHSIFEYFLPDGFEMGSLARNISKARFISRILVRSRSHAVFLYSKIVSRKLSNAIQMNRI